MFGSAASAQAPRLVRGGGAFGPGPGFGGLEQQFQQALSQRERVCEEDREAYRQQVRERHAPPPVVKPSVPHVVSLSDYTVFGPYYVSDCFM